MFNGDDVEIPNQAEDRWGNYKNPESMKLAWLTAYSWEQKGFQIIPFKIQEASKYFKGWMLESEYKYNGFLGSLIDYFDENKMEGVWFTSIDVVNQRLNYFANFLQGNDFICLNHSFSMAAGYITSVGAEEMLGLLRKYDMGEYKRLQYNFDEHVLRHYFSGKVIYYDYMTFPPNMNGKLLHFSRSTLQHYPYKFS